MKIRETNAENNFSTVFGTGPHENVSPSVWGCSHLYREKKNDTNSTEIAESKIYISYKNFLKVRDRL